MPGLARVHADARPGRPAPPQPVVGVDAGRVLGASRGARQLDRAAGSTTRSCTSPTRTPRAYAAWAGRGAADRGRVGVRRARRARGRRVHVGRRGPARRPDHGQHLGRPRLPVAQHRRERRGCGTAPVGIVPAERVRPVRHGRQRVGVDRRLVDEPAPRRRRQAVLRPDATRAAATSSAATTRASRSSRIPRKVIKGGSHLCADTYCLRYRPAARRPQMIDTGMSHIGFRCVRRADTLHDRAAPRSRMTDDRPILPSWRPGPTRDAVVAFLDAVRVGARRRARRVLRQRRHAVVRAAELRRSSMFFVDALKTRVGRRSRRSPSARVRGAARAATARRSASSGSSGSRLALVEPVRGRVAGGVRRRGSRVHGRAPRTRRSAARSRTAVYQPMLELIDELRRRRRSSSPSSPAVAPSSCGRSARTSTACRPRRSSARSIDYEFGRDDDGRPTLRRIGRDRRRRPTRVRPR